MSNELQYSQHLLKALDFAAEKHRDQRRKGVEASPYINHPIQVAEVLATYGEVDDLTTLIAAILHDTIEDTKTSSAELEYIFGSEVAGYVREVSDDKKLPKLERKRLQILSAPHKSRGAKLIKLADKCANVQDVIAYPPEDWSLERRLEYLDWSEQVIAGVRGVNPALEHHFDALMSNGRKVLVEIG